ncbi:glycosyl hydrolase family 28-related protein [Cohnella cellulosilytica]|uniref:Glycosyl hydrolase family 28-related protein n=1 Tax=Cohnella cellulosilytica TaxID=986710 RepID=A0ABW2FMP1_9BACL
MSARPRAFGQAALAFVLAAVVLGALAAPGTAFAEDPRPSWELIEPKYPAADTFVAAYDVTDYGAKGDGAADETSVFQRLLDSIGRLGGGTLFVPEGKYAIRGNLYVPKGVTLRGEWKKPVKGEPVRGTILMAYAGRGDEEAPPLLTLESSSAVRDVAIWYPEQTPDDIVPYPPAIVFGRPNVFGNEFNNAINITLVNAYSGIVFSRANGGTGPVVSDVYGTPLSRGVEIDHIVDVGRIERIDFSPAYWAGSGLDSAPAPGSAYADWIREHGTGIVMRRNDWSYTSFVTIEGYRIGFHAAPSVASPGAVPNGHNYGLNLIGCRTGIFLEGVSGEGIMFTRVRIAGAETGIAVGPDTAGAVQAYGVEIEASGDAIAVDPASKTRLLLRESVVKSGRVAIGGGTFSASDSDFDNAAPQIAVGEEARSLLTGNRFKEEADIDNRSKYISVIDHEPLAAEKLPAFPEIAAETRLPARMALYVVTDAPFGAVNDGRTDATAAIQAALDRAGADGGGVVFLPPGKYKALGRLVVPSGVELKGAVDSRTVPTGKGSVLETYAGRGEPDGEPFLKLMSGSGVRGITFNYPEQTADQLSDIAAYPYLIQAAGDDVYIVNVAMRAAYNGIDLFTHRTDRHYLDFVTGHVFRSGVKVGGGARDGKIYNLQFNPINYAAGRESKFGGWPNSPEGDNKAVYDYGYENLDFLTLGHAEGELLYNNFHYGSARGVVLIAEDGQGPSGASLGLGVDGAQKAMAFEGIGRGGLPFINSQIVSIGGGEGTRYLETSASFAGEAQFYGADFWGSPAYAVELAGGTLELRLAHAGNAGQKGFALLNGGALRLDQASIGSTRALVNADRAPSLFARASITDMGGVNLRQAGEWKHNLGNILIGAPSKPQEASAPASPSRRTASEAAPAASGAPAAREDGGDGSNAGAARIVAIVVATAGAIGVILYLAGAKKRKAVSRSGSD